MILPDKIIIDLKTINKRSKELVKFLKQVKKTIKKSPVIDVGNDVEYSIKSLNAFPRALKSLIETEGKKYDSDIFGNVLSNIKFYNHVEIMFSERYKYITSMRLVGKRNNKFVRYVFFNIENIFEPTTINLIKNYDSLIDEQKNFKEEKNYVEILQEYFTPSPFLISDDKIKKLVNISVKYDEQNKNKTFEDVLKQNKELNSGDLKTSIYDANQQSERRVDDISLLATQAEDIKSRIDTLQQQKDYLGTINLIHSELIDKFNIPDVFQYIDENLKILPDPTEFLSKLPTTDLLDKIDEYLPPKEKKKVYKQFIKELNKPESPINLRIILKQLEDFINSKLPKGNKITLSEKDFKKGFKDFKNLLNNFKERFPNLYCQVETFFNAIFPTAILVGVIIALVALPFILLFMQPKIPKIPLSEFLTDRIGIDLKINNIFGDFRDEIENNILSTLSCALCALTKALLELLNKCNMIDDFALENIFPLPEIQKTNEKSKLQSLDDERWTRYIQYSYQLLINTEQQTTERQELPSEFDELRRNSGVKQKLISKNKIHQNPEEIDVCETKPPLLPTRQLNKKQIDSLKNKTLKQLTEAGDVDSLIEKLKEYCYSGADKFFITQNVEDEYVIDALRFLSLSLREQPIAQAPRLPLSPEEISKNMSDMVEQIENILNEQEVNSLLNGTYTEDTAEIARTIAKLNFPTLTDRVDPIKYFRMLGKVVGSGRKPNLSNIKNNIDLNIFGIKI